MKFFESEPKREEQETPEAITQKEGGVCPLLQEEEDYIRWGTDGGQNLD